MQQLFWVLLEHSRPFYWTSMQLESLGLPMQGFLSLDCGLLPG